MTSADAPIAEASRRGAKLGAWSLIVAGFVLLWVVLELGLAIVAMSDRAQWAAPIAYVMFFAGAIVVPVGLVVVVVLAILAMVRNRRLGKVLAGVALLLFVVLAIIVIAGIMGSSGLFGMFS